MYLIYRAERSAHYVSWMILGDFGGSDSGRTRSVRVESNKAVEVETLNLLLQLRKRKKVREREAEERG